MEEQKILDKKIQYREKFDIAVSRAVANLTVLSELCHTFCKSKRIFCCYEGTMQ